MSVTFTQSKVMDREKEEEGTRGKFFVSLPEGSKVLGWIL